MLYVAQTEDDFTAAPRRRVLGELQLFRPGFDAGFLGFLPASLQCGVIGVQ